MAPSAQLLDILGIPGSTSPSSAIPQGEGDFTNDSVEVVRRGLSIESFKRVASYYQLSDLQMSKVVGTSIRTIVRLQIGCIDSPELRLKLRKYLRVQTRQLTG
jgi:hypothetical protein